MAGETSAAKRAAYHHGDLRQALIGAGLDLARQGGPDAVGVREVTRRVGVAPNAAYRHFRGRDALLAAVCSAAQAEVARAIDAYLEKIDSAQEPAARARARFRAVGLGYLRFAQAQPGVFRTAFWTSPNLAAARSPERRGPGGRTPFELLSAALDELVAAGVLAPQRRPGAEFLAWSAVHGLATLLIDGPLRGLSGAQVRQLEDRLVTMVEQGLEDPQPPPGEKRPGAPPR